jgi:hypothetical protein
MSLVLVARETFGRIVNQALSNILSDVASRRGSADNCIK